MLAHTAVINAHTCTPLYCKIPCSPMQANQRLFREMGFAPQLPRLLKAAVPEGAPEGEAGKAMNSQVGLAQGYQMQDLSLERPLVPSEGKGFSMTNMCHTLEKET